MPKTYPKTQRPTIGKNMFNLTQCFIDGGQFTQTCHNQKYYQPQWEKQFQFILNMIENNIERHIHAALYTTLYTTPDPRHKLLEVRNHKLVYVNPFFYEVLEKANSKLSSQNLKPIRFNPDRFIKN